MIKFLTGAAAIALAASAVTADPGGQGKGGGPGKGGGNDHAAHAQGGPGGGNANGGDREAHGNSGSEKRAEARQDRGRANDAPREARANDRRDDDVRGNRGRDSVVREARGRDDDRIRGDDDRDTRIARENRRGFDWDDLDGDRSRGLIDGCPPGLAKKNNGCMPPGLARARASAYDNPDWWNFDRRGMDLGDGDYRYRDGYLVRYGDRGVESWLPLLGGALSPGNLWPSQYAAAPLPAYYQDYYGLGAADGYRYFDDTLYRVDPQTNAITAIAALLTGDPFAVGQPMPAGYGVYNVPSSFRDQYVDGPDAAYRYSDGYVYEVDPTTQLVQAAIQLLT